MARRDGLVPRPLEPRLPPRARAPRPRHGDARRGHRRHARRPVVHARAAQPDELPRHQRALPRRELRDGRPQRRSTSRPSTSSRRSRPRSCSATAATCVVDGQITIGTLLAFFLYLANFFDPVQQLSQLYNTFLSATAALDKIIDVLDEEPEIVDAPDARDAAARSTGTSASRTSASATATLPEVLHGIDLDVPAGTTVALVGHTGAGKSTIAKLLARFYDPREGRITIDGHDLRDVTQESLRRQLGIVPQEGFLFAGTVAENIAFGRPDATARGDRARRPRAVGADDFIARARGRLRHAARRARLPALARPAPARRVRARAARRSAHPDPRRGDVVGRHRHRAADRARRCAASSPAARRS